MISINPSAFKHGISEEDILCASVDPIYRVELEERGGSRIMRLLKISEELRQILNVKVDVVSPSALKEQVSEQARKELVLL